MIKLTLQKNNGYAVLELVFYIAFFAILSILLIDAMIIMSKSFRETSLHAELVQSGTILERISREIRQASDITSVSATDLVLLTTDEAGASKTVRFLLSGSNLELFENGVFIGNLNTSKITVNAIAFTQITTTVGKAVKVVLTVGSTSSPARTEIFYDTVILRGNY